MTPFEVSVLRIINENDGQFSWYQLERALGEKKKPIGTWVPPGGLMPVLHGFEASGYVVASTGHHPSQPLYSITQAGQQALKALP